MKDDGFVMFSTLLQPENIDNIKCDWFYAGPRNGHISLHSEKSLSAIASLFNCNFVSFGNLLHFMFYDYPHFLKDLKIINN